MSPTWLDNLERGLEERLEQFLRSNPSQDQLLREQHLQDRQRDLHNRRGQQQLQARELRRQLLTLAEQVQAWTTRSEKARRASALELAQRADQHVAALMQQGRELWEEFEALGLQFAELEAQLNSLKTQEKQSTSRRSLDEDWALFEAQQELEELRRNQGLN
ncbi:hercynine metabolism protein [Synechococcus sp. MU1655]|uniref:hercynine metabolism protein n=1 Tax=Synechococcus sp. MU1655 TaxID=2508355 RepID=UPI00202750F8|nr:hercynine metabolism protein [Synechococcus sp. MU1655]